MFSLLFICVLAANKWNRVETAPSSRILVEFLCSSVAGVSAPLLGNKVSNRSGCRVTVKLNFVAFSNRMCVLTKCYLVPSPFTLQELSSQVLQLFLFGCSHRRNQELFFLLAVAYERGHKRNHVMLVCFNGLRFRLVYVTLYCSSYRFLLAAQMQTREKNPT